MLIYIYRFAVSEMDRYGIHHSACVCHPHCKLPTSCIVLSASSGSRTMVYSRYVHIVGFF